MNTTSQERLATGGGAGSGLAVVAAMVVGAVLLFSAFTKMISAPAFVSTVEDYQFLAPSLVLPAATLLIGIEFGLALMLILGPGRRLAAGITVPLAAVFMVFNVIAIQRGMADCGCFGEVIKVAPEQELVLNAVMVVLAGVVLRFGRPFATPHPMVTPTVGWGGTLLGVGLFLLGGPVVSNSGESMDVTTDDLEVLADASPPLAEIPDDAFFYFFSADCDHCWAYAGAVQLMHDRVEGLEVHAVTNSDPMSLEAFEDAFLPTYPIHRLDPATFDAMVPTYPSAVFVQAGGVSQTWAGWVPSHRQIAESAGYFYREAPPVAADDAVDEGPANGSGASAADLLGGTLSGRGQ